MTQFNEHIRTYPKLMLNSSCLLLTIYRLLFTVYCLTPLSLKGVIILQAVDSRLFASSL